MTLVCIPIVGPCLPDIRRQLSQCRDYADVVEITYDLYDGVSVDDLLQVRKENTLSWLVRVRSKAHGGGFQGSRVEQHALLRRLTALEPEYLDVESGAIPDEVAELKRQSPETQIILSQHLHEGMPGDIEHVVQMLMSVPADQYKIAVKVDSSVDALKMIVLAMRVNQDSERLTAIGMGEEGSVTRILAPIMGCPLLFASLDRDHATAPGQIPYAVLRDVYHVKRLNRRTRLYGLIGDPVDKSLGYLTHNSVKATLGLNAVYVRMRVQKHELAEFLAVLQELPWNGLSVTMPLKEEIIPYLDNADPSVKASGAANTIVIENKQFLGYNTDGLGALQAVQEALIAHGRESLHNKPLAIIGAGGAARAIAWEAIQRGADVTLFNRSVDKALQVAKELGCQGQGLEALGPYLRTGCEALFQTTPVGMSPNVGECPIDASALRPETLVFDAVSNPKETRLLREAAERGCVTVSGIEMWVNQAVGQFVRWFGDTVDSHTVRRLIREKLGTLA